MSRVSLSAREKVRFVVWASLAACAAVGWNVFIWKADLSNADPVRLSAAVGTSLAAIGLSGGFVVPRREVSWSDLLGECVVGAAVIGVACFFTAAWISASAANSDNPLAIGFWGVFTFLASGLVMTPFFLGGYVGRSALLRVIG